MAPFSPTSDDYNNKMEDGKKGKESEKLALIIIIIINIIHIKRGKHTRRS